MTICGFRLTFILGENKHATWEMNKDKEEKNMENMK
jgi:hypothetical protein